MTMPALYSPIEEWSIRACFAEHNVDLRPHGTAEREEGDGGDELMIQNERLHNACEAWLRAELKLLQPKPLTYIQEDQVIITETNTWKTQAAPARPDYHRLVSTSASLSINIPAFNDLVEVIAAHPELSSLLLVRPDAQAVPLGEQKSWLFNSFLSIFIAFYLQVASNFDFQSGVFETIYSKFEAYIYLTQPIDSIWLFSILNLSVEIDAVQLEPNIKIRKATEEERIQS